MLILLSWFSFLSAYCCELLDAPKIISLSGPVTVALQEMNLLQGIKGISIFHPISLKDFQGERYPGGIFLSSKLLKEFEGHVVFYDESRELRRFFTSRPGIKSVEVKTRGLVPTQVSSEVIKGLSPFLKGCAQVANTFLQRTRTETEDLLSHIQDPLRFIFFLGEIRPKRLPEMILGRDGVLEVLVQKKKLLSYPTELPSLNWSAKILENLKDYRRVGLIDNGPGTPRKLEHVEDRSWNLFFPGILIPGISQVRGFRYLIAQGRILAPP